MSNKLKVVFDEPGNGWVGVKLSCGDNATEIIASYTPYDSFLDLVNALHNLFLYEGEWRVIWNEQPVEHEFRFRRSADLVSLEALSFFDHRRNVESPNRWLTARGSYEEIAIPFWSALRNLQGRFSPEDLRLRWHRDFPSKEIESLTSLLHSRPVSKTSPE